MKATVTLTSRGGVTLPAKLRDALGIMVGDLLIAEVTPEGILLRPVVPVPIETYSAKRIRDFDAGEAKLQKVLQRKKSRA